MNNLNQLIANYTQALSQGEIQIAYKGIMEFMGKMRAELIKKYPEYQVSGIYQGYMDMSYFSMASDSLKDKGLKIAIVYLHETGCFEVWLSARNREIARKYVSEHVAKTSDEVTLFHDPENQDALVEGVLVSGPDFENQEKLIEIIEQGVERFIKVILISLFSL